MNWKEYSRLECRLWIVGSLRIFWNKLSNQVIKIYQVLIDPVCIQIRIGGCFNEWTHTWSVGYVRIFVVNKTSVQVACWIEKLALPTLRARMLQLNLRRSKGEKLRFRLNKEVANCCYLYHRQRTHNGIMISIQVHRLIPFGGVCSGLHDFVKLGKFWRLVATW